MGYHLSNLLSIASNDRHEYFLFLVSGGGWDEKSVWIMENFDSIAATLQGKSVIVRGFISDFDDDVLTRYKSDVETFLLKTENAAYEFDESLYWVLYDLKRYSRELRWGTYPLIIVTNQNPSVSISEQKQSVFYLVPLGGLSSVTEAEELVLAIVQGTRLDDFTRLERLLEERFPRSVSQNAIEIINQTVELKPNFFGLGINLNRLIQLFLQQRSAKLSKHQ